MLNLKNINVFFLVALRYTKLDSWWETENRAYIFSPSPATLDFCSRTQNTLFDGNIFFRSMPLIRCRHFFELGIHGTFLSTSSTDIYVQMSTQNAHVFFLSPINPGEILVLLVFHLFVYHWNAAHKNITYSCDSIFFNPSMKQGPVALHGHRADTFSISILIQKGRRLPPLYLYFLSNQIR